MPIIMHVTFNSVSRTHIYAKEYLLNGKWEKRSPDSQIKHILLLRRPKLTVNLSARTQKDVLWVAERVGFLLSRNSRRIIDSVGRQNPLAHVHTALISQAWHVKRVFGNEDRGTVWYCLMNASYLVIFVFFFIIIYI